MCLQDKLEAELDAAGLLVTPERPKPRALQYADLSKLTFLCACLKEAMRLHPTIPMVSRCEKCHTSTVGISTLEANHESAA